MGVDLRDLFDKDRALSVPQLLAEVPATPGLYTIWIRSLESLPPELRAYQCSIAKMRDLIYIGRATAKGGLKQRLGRRDLCGKGDASFFRSIGVCLDFKPPAHSIEPDSSNFKFSEQDREAMRLWLEQHVVASYLVRHSIEEVRETESCLIREYRPCFNIDSDNPDALEYVCVRHLEARNIARRPKTSSR